MGGLTVEDFLRGGFGFCEGSVTVRVGKGRDFLHERSVRFLQKQEVPGGDREVFALRGGLSDLGADIRQALVNAGFGGKLGGDLGSVFKTGDRLFLVQRLRSDVDRRGRFATGCAFGVHLVVYIHDGLGVALHRRRLLNGFVLLLQAFLEILGALDFEGLLCPRRPRRTHDFNGGGEGFAREFRDDVRPVRYRPFGGDLPQGFACAAHRALQGRLHRLI